MSLFPHPQPGPRLDHLHVEGERSAPQDLALLCPDLPWPTRALGHEPLSVTGPSTLNPSLPSWTVPATLPGLPLPPCPLQSFPSRQRRPGFCLLVTSSRLPPLAPVQPVSLPRMGTCPATGTQMWARIRLTGSSGRDRSPYLCCRERTHNPTKEAYSLALRRGLSALALTLKPLELAAWTTSPAHLYGKPHPGGERTLDPQGHPDRCCHAELFSLSLCHCESSQPLGLPPPGRGRWWDRPSWWCHVLCLEFCIFSFNFISDAATSTIHWN